MEWIRSQDSLPKVGIEVIGFMVHEFEYIMQGKCSAKSVYYNATGSYDGKKWNMEGHDNQKKDSVYAWIYLTDVIIEEVK